MSEKYGIQDSNMDLKYEKQGTNQQANDSFLKNSHSFFCYSQMVSQLEKFLGPSLYGHMIASFLLEF